MITDLSGRLVLESRVQNETDIEALANGIYVVQILDQTGQIIHTQKLIVE
ncbi:MAG: T9SS type A sorting domain-containing protein [Crocinitomicaceae bacterium]|nr:T9SS type A sorting domain-containing protein [Crocinitomicaceae bacterium]